eukprot:m.284041 g.284041  ORF g.284041 m.284041 type:complete len:457 (-) comp16193_c0_seq1:40-1410(-)
MRLSFVVLLAQVTNANKNAVGQTPIMGWSGYNAFMQNSGHCDKAGAGGYNETTFVQTMDALVSSGLKDAGYEYLNADDCWIAENRTADGKLTWDVGRFPHGMPWLIDQAHSRGLKLGLYAAASTETCRQYPGSQGYEDIDAQTFAEWGADFAKLDSCGGTLASGNESWYNQYGRWSDAMNASGRQMVFSCSWAVYFAICAAKYPPSEWETQCGTIPWDDHYIARKCHMWRYGEDLSPIWGTGKGTLMNGGGGSGVGDIISFASSVWANQWRAVSEVGAFNDPDFLVVGCPLDRPCEGYSQKTQTPLNIIEQQTQFSMWCLLQAPLIIGSDVRSASPAALKILTNKEAIRINQDASSMTVPKLVSGGQCTTDDCPHWVLVWGRELSDGAMAVAVVNMGNKTTEATTVPLSDLFCQSCAVSSAQVLDVWAATTKEVQSAIELSVGPHETKLLRVTPQH